MFPLTSKVVNLETNDEAKSAEMVAETRREEEISKDVTNFESNESLLRTLKKMVHLQLAWKKQFRDFETL